MHLYGNEKILVLRLSSLGDILLTTPLIKLIKLKYPGTEIDFLLKSAYSKAIENNPYIKDVLYYESDNLIEILKSKDYRYVIDLQNNLRSRKLTGQLSSEIMRFKKPWFRKFTLVQTGINLYEEIIPVPLMYCRTAGIEPEDLPAPEIFIPANINVSVEKDSGTILLCPGSRHFTKMWPKEYFIELGNMLIKAGYKVGVTGGSGDAEICDEITGKINEAVNLCKGDNLYKIAYDMKNSSAVVCNDSGLMHLASASEVPFVAIFGSTVKEFGFAPYVQQAVLIENSGLSCRPCSHIGLSKCPKKHFGCMKSIKPEIIFKEINDMVNK